MLHFPHPLTVSENGLLAIGGDLSEQRLLLAYTNGIFPWFNNGPVLWWYTHPRCVLFPEDLKVSKSMKSLLKKGQYSITTDKNFEDVIQACSRIKRNNQDSTWLSPQMIDAYQRLFHRGYAHSLEVWEEDQLIGGLYGIAIGRIFSGESMFSLKNNASKIGLIHLVSILIEKGFWFIDCQQDTDHMRSMGSSLISKEDYWQILRRNKLEAQIW